MNIEQDLSFNKHISAKMNKVNSIAGLISRSFEYIDKDNFETVIHCSGAAPLGVCSSHVESTPEEAHKGYRKCAEEGI